MKPRTLLFIGWALFLVSMFLPWFGVGRGGHGWSGWLFSLIGLLNLLHLVGQDTGRYIIGMLPVINILLLMSPFFYIRLRRGSCRKCWLACLFATLLLVLMLLLGLLSTEAIVEGIRPGFYLWCLSVLLVTIGLYGESQRMGEMFRA